MVTAVETVLLARGIGLYGPQPLAMVFLSVGVFIAVFLVVLPRLLVSGDPERVLESAAAAVPAGRPRAAPDR